MPHTKKPTAKYVIHDARGRELGESEGKDGIAAVLALFRMDPKEPRIRRATVMAMVRDHLLHLERVA
jgi:hypothetical protein